MYFYTCMLTYIHVYVHVGTFTSIFCLYFSEPHYPQYVCLLGPLCVAILQLGEAASLLCSDSVLAKVVIASCHQLPCYLPPVPSVLRPCYPLLVPSQ